MLSARPNQNGFDPCYSIAQGLVKKNVQLVSELKEHHIMAFSYFYDRGVEFGLIGKIIFFTFLCQNIVGSTIQSWDHRLTKQMCLQTRITRLLPKFALNVAWLFRALSLWLASFHLFIYLHQLPHVTLLCCHLWS